MRLISLISLFSATSTLGGITYIGNSINWNPYILNIFEIGSNAQTDSRTTTPLVASGGVHVNKVTSKNLRKQSTAITNARAWNHVFVPTEDPAGSGTWCVREDALPPVANMKNEYLAADHILEIQVISEMMADANIDLDKNYSAQQLADLRTAINANANVAYIPYEVNCAKAVVIRKFVKNLLNADIPKDDKCKAMKKDTTDEMKAYLSRFCSEIITTAGTVTNILKAPTNAAGMDVKKVEVLENVAFVLECMGLTINKPSPGVFTCAPVVPCP